jgi:predicted hydrocarbon binding protein
MEIIPKSGFYLPNKIARLAIISMGEVVGKNGLNVILKMARLPHLVEELPPSNLDREFDFSDFSSINIALEDLYGARGGRGLALRAGRATFTGGLRNFGAMAGVGSAQLKALPMNTRLRLGLPALAKIFSQTSDQICSVEEKDTTFHYLIHRCPVCWGRHTDKPACNMTNGLLQSCLLWVSGGSEFSVTQARSKSTGSPACEFIIDKKPIT